MLHSEYRVEALQWRCNGYDGVSNHRRLDGVLNRLWRCRSKETSKLRVTGLCEGNSPVSYRWIPCTKGPNAQHISIWWRHHRISIIVDDIQFVEAKQSMNITSQYQCLALAWHHKLTYVSLWWYRNTRLEMAVLGDNSESAMDSYFHRVLCIKNIKYRMRTKMTYDSPRITILWSLVKRFANDIHITRENHWRIASLVAINRY